MPDYGVGMLGVSAHLPGKIQTNEELCQIIPGLSPEWIIEKTGIKRRYHVTKDETASSLAIAAARKAIQSSGIAKDKIGIVIIASFSQDYLFPPLSAKLHSSLELSRDCQIIDINTNCTGMVTALSIGAERMLIDSSIENALVIGVEIHSRFTNVNDKDTSIFFSDGASAIILGKTDKSFGYRSAKFMTDSSTYESVRMRGGGSSYPVNQKSEDLKSLFIEQNGLATWKQAITNLPLVIRKLLEGEGKEMSDIDFFIFHQANGFLIDYIVKKLRIPPDKTFTNVEEIGNTGSASIGIALSEAFSKGLIKSGSNLVLAGIGAGFNFGACLFKVQ